MMSNYRALRSKRPGVQPLHSSSTVMERPASKHRSGFTLLELMVVVSIVAVVVGLALPTMSQQLADQKTNQMALDIVASARLARSSATAYGRAHLMRWDPAGAAGLGTVEVYRGINNGCNTNNWGAIVGVCAGNVNCIEAVHATEYQSGNSTYQMSVIGALNAGGDICFEPNGTVRWRPGPAGFFTNNLVATGGQDSNGGFVFNIQRRNTGTDVGVARQVLIPLGGDARKIR